MLIEAGQTVCFQISDVSTVWVQGHIFDRDLPSVRNGDAVEETNPSFNRTFHGAISYIGSFVDPNTRTTPVRIVTSNPGGLLKKDMFVDAVIRTSRRNNILVVPVAAVLRDDKNEPIVYVQAAARQVRAAFGNHRPAAGRTGGDRQRLARRRKRGGRRQPLPAVRQRDSIGRKHHDRETSLLRPAAAIPDCDRFAGPDALGRYFFPEAAHRRLSGSFAAARGNHHAVARPRRRGNRTAGQHSDRNRDERHSAAGSAALDFALRAFRHRDEFRIRRRSVLRARAGVRAHGQRLRCPTVCSPPSRRYSAPAA